jgi:hypothetical protein
MHRDDISTSAITGSAFETMKRPPNAQLPGLWVPRNT